MTPPDTDLYKAVGRIEAKVDILLSVQTAHDGRMDRHSHRIGSLERSKAYLVGLSAGISAIVAIVLKAIL